MKYFEYIFLLCFVILSVLPLIVYILRLRLKHFQKIAGSNILRTQQKNHNITFFSSHVINKAVILLFYTRKQNALKHLLCGHLRPILDIIDRKDPFLALLLEAHIDAQKVFRRMLKNKKEWLKHREYFPYLPIISHLLHKPYSTMQFVQNVSIKKISGEMRSYRDYIAAYVYLQNADMLSASEHASNALKYFQKHKYRYEEMLCYIVLGEIYRLSCINDVAQTMLESALKIAQQLPTTDLQAKVITSLGMLMLYENRPQEAEDYYQKALHLNISTATKADILNQAALLKLSLRDYQGAAKDLKEASQFCAVIKNLPTKAFNIQLWGQLYLEQKHFQKAADQFLMAESVYKKTENFSARAECLYSLADAYAKFRKFKLSESYLRKLIDFTRHHPGNFHLAHAYSLLGLIYIQRHDLNRAKVLIQQSLQLEQKHDRCEGLVADYANLALIERLRGNAETARHNLGIALEFAQKAENQELIDAIQNKLGKN
ncbi:MAG: tetratricopeptide repeat protein [Alphaproteobacteria bacterium]|nr:tetratricopeptide repeat protein [Alphaproteobacteria bacterium]